MYIILLYDLNLKYMRNGNMYKGSILEVHYLKYLYANLTWREKKEQSLENFVCLDCKH